MNPESKFFITGANGFVGSYLIRALLSRGYKHISALHRPGCRMGMVEDLKDRIRWVAGDLFDFDLLAKEMNQANIVIHAAAMISFLRRDMKAMLKANVEGTAHVINAALEGRVDKFLHISSVAALGRSDENQLIDENTQYSPSSLNTGYGLTKHLAEMEVYRGVSEGLNATILNPSMIMGAGYWDTGTARIIDTVYRGLKFYPTGSSGYVDVRDVARMSIDMLEKDLMKTNLICCAASLPIREMLGMICSIFDLRPPHIKLSPALREGAWRLERIRAFVMRTKPLLTRETLRTSSYHFKFDNTKSCRDLDFRYTPITDTIRDTCMTYSATRKIGKDFGVLNPPVS